jgi:hypothetical protein
MVRDFPERPVAQFYGDEIVNDALGSGKTHFSCSANRESYKATQNI